MTAKKSFVYLLMILVGLSTTVIGQPINQSSNPYSNPALIYGSDFGRMFQTFYKQGQFQLMMHFTSQESIAHYGSGRIYRYYKSMDFGYQMKLKSINRIGTGYSLNYLCSILATRKIIRMELKIENDTCKILLPVRFQASKIFLWH